MYISFKNIDKEKPNCYITGDFDGKKSDIILVQDSNKNYWIAVCYIGILDGNEFCDFYTAYNEYLLSDIKYWANLEQ